MAADRQPEGLLQHRAAGRQHGPDARLVVEMRRSFQQTMRDELSAAVERITGRKVIAFMSDSHLEPDYSAEIFVLAPEEPDLGASTIG